MSEPRNSPFTSTLRIVVCLVVFAIIAIGFVGSAMRVETAEKAIDTIEVSVVKPQPRVIPSGAVPFDFDGDSKTDIGRWHGASTEYKVWKSGSSSYMTETIGTSSARPVAGEFDDDGKYDVGTYLNGTWTVKLSKGSSTITSSPGTTGDIPVMGNFDGTTVSDCSVYRPSDNTWRIDPDCTGSTPTPVSYGASGDIPIPGDYDGDGTTDKAVYRPSTGYWYASRSTAGSLAVQWGISTDVPMAADFDNDGKDDLVIFRPSSGTWYVLNSQYGFTTYSTQVWGNWYDQPVVGYYDNDSIADYAIWRPTTGEWWILKSTGGNLTYSLGVPGDTAIPSAFTKQVGGTATGYELATDRLDPENATGGTDYYSRNYSWGTSLVSLPGRSGMDAGLGIGYNSLVWIKTGGSMYFDPDSSNVAPGFRMGPPTIEPIYYNDARSKWAYMMVTPSGKRVEFVETSVDELFTTTDSGYTQLITGTTTAPNVPSEGVTMTVKSTDGTQMIYSWNTGAYRCTRVKDRNGNYIDYAYSAYGKLESMEDTLGRVVNVNYDGYGRISTITQNWNASNGTGSASAHTYATLTYTTKTVATDWGVPFYGPPNDTAVTVLDKIAYADGSATKFEYNGYVQVKKITNVAADTTTNLNYVETDLADVSGSQSDVPRIGETRSWAKDFNLVGGTATAVKVKNTLTTSQTYDLGSASGTATKVQVWVDGHPNNLRSNTFVYASGWNESLPIGTEDCITTSSSCTTQKRWTWNDWTQDNESVSYILNPRIEDSKVGDGTNTKRTTIGYGSNGYGLPEEVKQYESDGTTVLKTQTTSYNLSSNYTDRRIIGLPSETRLYQGTSSTGTLMSKVTFAYDENGYTDTTQNSSSPTNHDSSGYGTSFNYRGNQTSVKRWDVRSGYESNSSYAVSSSTVYNILGSPILQKDALNRETEIIYNDNYNDTTTSRGTYAYPTTIKDANENVSTIKYRFDIGANVWAQSPTPAGSGNSIGKTTSREYGDALGRLTKQIVDNTGAYTEYEYASTGNALTTYSTIVDVDNSNSANAADEIATESLFDGAGRLLKTRTANPGSTGEYSGKKVEYDLLGRAFRETVPTEMNSSWNPAGDDYRGNTWLWNTKEFDWKGRVVRSIPSDSNGSDGKDTLYEYAGCGCAGGQITTVKGPVTTAIDVGGTTQTTKRRTQKIYADILGRTARTELWDLDGGGSTPYRTVKNTYNGRDQITLIEEFVGGTSGTHQDTTISYDGHGRPSQVHKPEFDSGKYTTTTYNTDDSVATITDPRDAVTTYTYGLPTASEKRAVVTNITYSVPSGSNIPVPAAASFTYDNAGNRTQMTDGLGTVSYVYDELSRLKSESRNFTDTLTNEPSSGVYKLEYEYTLSGLKSYKDPFGESVTYTHDATGRTIQIGASAFTGRTTGTGAFATNVSYRAFGAIKGVNFATDSTTYVTVGYDSALRPSSYESTSSANSTDIHDRSYTYYNDGMLKETTNAVDAKFGQKNEYDFAGRLKKNDFGNTTAGVPYKQTISYDEFNHISARSTWDKDNNQRNYTAGFTNNRKSSGGYQNGTDTFDAAGQVTLNHFYNGKDNDKRWTFDAGGRMTEWLETSPYASTYWDEGATITFDGDGKAVKKRNRNRNRANGNTTYYEENQYDIISSVLGKTITTVNDTGAKTKTNVYLGSSVMAEQIVEGTNTFVSFKHVDPLTGSHQSTDATGEIFPNDIERIELDPLGTWANPSEAELQTPSGNYKNGGDMGNPEFGCTMESGAPAPCSTAAAEARYVGTLPSFQIIWGRDPRTLPGVIEVPPDGEPGDDEYESQSRLSSGVASAFSFIYADNFVAGHQGLMNFGESKEGGWGWMGVLSRRRLQNDPCAIKYNLFLVGSDSYLGMTRKSSTKRKDQYGTVWTVAAIREIASEWTGTAIRAGDISRKNGVDTPDHSEHMKGYQFDIGLFRLDGENQAVTYKDKEYDRESTQKLVDILEKHPMVKKIIVNDPKLKGTKLSRDTTGVHDNHLHVEFDDGCR